MCVCDWVYYTYHQGGHDRAYREGPGKSDETANDRRTELDSAVHLVQNSRQCGLGRVRWDTAVGDEARETRRSDPAGPYSQELWLPQLKEMEHAGWF
jgi:hypothetical protein